MVLGPKELLKLVKKIKLVEDLSERELTNPEGAGFDLRLGEVFKISGKAFLGETHRKTPDIESVMVYNEKKKQAIKIKPGEYFLVKTIFSRFYFYRLFLLFVIDHNRFNIRCLPMGLPEKSFS